MPGCEHEETIEYFLLDYYRSKEVWGKNENNRIKVFYGKKKCVKVSMTFYGTSCVRLNPNYVKHDAECPLTNSMYEVM